MKISDSINLVYPHHGQTGTLGKVIDSLIDMELSHHEAGWDNVPVMFYYIGQHNDGSLSTPQGARLGVNDQHPREDLRSIAYGMKNPLIAQYIYSAYKTKPICHSLIFECYINSSFKSPEELQKAIGKFNNPTSLADIPSSEEAREVFALFNNKSIWITRFRGKDPQIILSEITNPNIGGDMWDSLIDIHRTVLGFFNNYN